jgi:hypothetical protein
MMIPKQLIFPSNKKEEANEEQIFNNMLGRKKIINNQKCNTCDDHNNNIVDTVNFPMSACRKNSSIFISSEKNQQPKSTLNNNQPDKFIKFDTTKISSGMSDECEDVNENFDMARSGIPNRLILENGDKFIGDNGNVIEMEIFKGKNEKDFFFNLNDIEKGFEINCLLENIKTDRDYFRENDDYIYIQQNMIPRIFLTYMGILKVLVLSGNQNMKKFIDWSQKILFCMFDQNKQENKLKYGVSAATVRDVLDRCSQTISCVYLIMIGQANKFLGTSNDSNIYNNDDILCKFGRTEDFSRRLREHMKKYKRDLDADVIVLGFCQIDPKNISEAEKYISHYFEEKKVKISDETEMIVIEKSSIIMIKEQFKMLQKEYSGYHKNLIDQMSNIEDQNKDLIHKIKIMELEYENKLKEKDHELKEKEIKTLRELLASKKKNE